MISLLRQLRPDIKIVLSSALEDEVERLLLDAQITGYVLKPFTTEGLLGAVHRALTAQ